MDGRARGGVPVARAQPAAQRLRRAGKRAVHVCGARGSLVDFACARKTKEGTTPGPEVTWSDGVRRMYNLYPLCQVPAERLGEAEAHRGL